MDGLRAVYAVVELVVEVLYIHHNHSKALASAELGQPLRGFVEMLVRDEDVVRAPFRRSPVGGLVYGDGHGRHLPVGCERNVLRILPIDLVLEADLIVAFLSPFSFNELDGGTGDLADPFFVHFDIRRRKAPDDEMIEAIGIRLGFGELDVVVLGPVKPGIFHLEPIEIHRIAGPGGVGFVAGQDHAQQILAIHQLSGGEPEGTLPIRNGFHQCLIVPDLIAD